MATDPHATAPVREAGAAPVGQKVARYLLLERLGGGGGGEVYAAFDPVLDRKVALKFLHKASAASPALLREGRMLAKVVHPAVVEVHEVAFADGQAFLAMELADRGDLEAFAARAREQGQWQDVVAALVAVAEGIAAVHEAGVVHGDVKPSNVLRNAAGKFKVSDFGIARLGERGPTSGTEHHHAGTPAFMAPEQRVGAPPDERSDQYAFCVTAWAVLCGELPFPSPEARSTTAAAMSTTAATPDPDADKARGPPPWPGVRGVPSRVSDALVRGLQADPADRFVSMTALLNALRPSPARARRLRAAGVLGVLGLGAAGIYGYGRFDRAQKLAACAQTGAEIVGSWNPSAETDLRAALASADPAYGSAAADKVVPWLDAWVDRWQHAATEVCTQATVTERWDASRRERGRWCLTQARLQFDAAVAGLQVAEGNTAGAAVPLASSLPPTEVCVDAFVLDARPDPPEHGAHLATVEALTEIAAARALRRLGDYPGATRRVGRARELLDASSDSQLLGKALVVEGKVVGDGGDYTRGEALLVDAYVAAATIQDWGTAAIAAETLIFVVGSRLHRPKEAELWAAHAKVAADLGGDPSGLHAAGRASNLAVVKRGAGEYEESVALHGEALRLTEAALGPDHPSAAARLSNLGAVYIDMGKLGEAREVFERVAQVREETLGAGHPSSVSALNNLAVALGKGGNFRGAEALLRTVVERREAVLGPDHPQVGEALDNVAGMLTNLGEHNEAEPLLLRALKIKRAAGVDTMAEAQTLGHLASVYSAQQDPARAASTLERVLEIRERIKGAEHPLVGEALINLGTEYFLLDDLDRAEEAYARAEQIFVQAFGRTHSSVGAAINNLGDVALEAGRLAEAERRFLRAREIWTETLGPKHVNTLTAVSHLGTVRLDQGRLTEARALLEEAIAGLEHAQGGGAQLSAAREELAKVLRAD